MNYSAKTNLAIPILEIHKGFIFFEKKYPQEKIPTIQFLPNCKSYTKNMNTFIKPSEKDGLSLKKSWIILYVKVSKSRKRCLEFSILPKNKKKISWELLVYFFLFFCSFFGRIENTRTCFRDKLTFSFMILRALHVFLSSTHPRFFPVKSNYFTRT